MAEEIQNLPRGWGDQLGSPQPLTEASTPPAVEPAVVSSPPASPEEPGAIFNEKQSRGKVLKKILLILLVVLLIGVGAFFLFRKGGPKIKKSREATLTYWGLWEPEEVMANIISDWQKENPKIKINYIRQTPKEYRERLQSALARNEGPDIFRFHLTWLAMFKDELTPVPPKVISASQFEETFYPVVASQLRSGANYFGIPLMADSLALYYNKDIFQAAGKSPPKTWEELRGLANELTVKDEHGRIQTSGAALGVTGNIDHWSDILGLMMLQNGADLANPAACQKQGDEEVCLGADALTFYTIFNKVDQIWNETLPSSTTAFASGKLAMYFGPSWRAFEIKTINPELNFGIVPAPQLSDTNISWTSFWVEGVSQRSEYQEEAWEFLKFLSSKEALTKLYQAESNLRDFGELYPRQDMAEMLRQDPLVQPFIIQMPQAQTWYLCSNTYDNGINDRMIRYFQDAVNGVNSGQSAKEVLKTTSQGISQLLSQYGLASYTVR